MTTQDRRFRAKDYYVQDVDRATALRLVREHHYARGGSKTGVAFHGLFRNDEAPCLGAAWWLPPTKPAAASVWHNWRRVLSLTRLVVVPGLPTNAASFLLGRSIQRIREDDRWECLVTYADQGQGHEGTIYKATNWEYVGEVGPYANWYDPETGRQASTKRGPKTLSFAEMRARGFKKRRTKKHKFRYVL